MVGRMGAMENSSLRFAEAARVLVDGARALGLVAPAFRSPPRLEGDRSIRWRGDGGATVAVRYRKRPWPAVLADMIEGVVAANRLVAPAADRARTALWARLGASGIPEDGSAVEPAGGDGDDPGLKAVA